MRLDREIAVRIARPLGLGRREGVPAVSILMYHSVDDSGMDPTLHPYYEITTRPGTFRAQMEQLETEGYRVVPLRRLEEALAAPESKDGKSVVLTFDDGYRDFLLNAHPVLKERRFPSSLFIPTALAGSRLGEREYLDWREIRLLSEEGVGIGSHSVRHARLREMDDEGISREVVDSMREIEDKVGVPVDTFSFPYAFPQGDREFTERFRALLEKAGIRRCLTTIVGRTRSGDDPFFLKRIPVNEHDDPALFRAKLEGAYDWLRPIQYGIGRWKS